jgi:hypothetical protein
VLCLLPCNEIVLRAVLKAGWLDESGKLRPDAYIRDPRRDGDGLSVSIGSQTNIEDWLGGFKKSWGADSLHSGRILDLGLYVGQTADDVHEGAGPAVIAGLPSQDEDPARAESLASALAEMSRRLDRERRKLIDTPAPSPAQIVAEPIKTVTLQGSQQESPVRLPLGYAANRGLKGRCVAGWHWFRKLIGI